MLNNKPPISRPSVLFISILFGILTLLALTLLATLNSCTPPEPTPTPSVTTPPSPATTATPSSVTTSPITVTLTITPTLPDLELQLPALHVNAFADQDIRLDPNGVAVYAAPSPYPPEKLSPEIAQPKPGTIFMLTPISLTSFFPDALPSVEEFLEFVKAQPESQLAIGGLTVIRPWEKFTQAGDYAILFKNEGEITFTPLTEGDVVNSQAIVRHLPIPITQPTAIITARQLCLTWATVQICSQIDVPPDPAWLARVEQMREELELNFDINPNLLVPDIEGRNALEECVAAFRKDQPDYARCRSNVLAVPASTSSLPITNQLVTADPFLTRSLLQVDISIGLLDVIEPISGEAFQDELFMTPTEISPGAYNMIEMSPNGSTPTTPITIPLRLTNATATYYLPVTGGFQFIGTSLDNDPEVEENEAAIFMLGFRLLRLCIFSFQRSICASP